MEISGNTILNTILVSADDIVIINNIRNEVIILIIGAVNIIKTANPVNQKVN